MFHRSGTHHNKFEITAPPDDLANKLKLHHPPPALLLTSSSQNKKPLSRNTSYPLGDNQKGLSETVEITSHEILEKRKKKNVFSFLKKKQAPSQQAYETVSTRKLVSRTPENLGRKQINYDSNPGSSVLPVRRPHSSNSDRHNAINIHNRSMRSDRRRIESGDEADDIDNYPRFKPARLAPPIPIQNNSTGYDSLEKYRNIKLSQSDDGSSIGGSGQSSIAMIDSSAPGLVGIKNHGNTCFMNSIMQVLSNTEPFLHYILTNKYKKDLSKSKDKPSTALLDPVMPNADGAVTEYTALLIKCLWNGQYENKISSYVRDVVGLWADQFKGHNQHDAQEFLLWLLDRLHEDLNLATGEQLIKLITNNNTRNEEQELAAETLSDHLRRHDSLIYNLFSAQYHSSLQCPSCNYLSNTFDPYLCVSLSVPRRGSRPLYITMARRYQNSTKLMVFGLSLKVNAIVRDIQRQLSVEARTLPHYLVIGEMKQDGFYRFFRPNDPISLISEYALLYAYEVTPHKGEFAPSLSRPSPTAIMSNTNETIFIILQCRVGQGEYSKRFGGPMCLRVWRDLTYSQLQSVVFKHMKHYLHDEVNPEVVCRDYIFFKCVVLDGLQGQEYLDPYSPSPFMCPSVEKALSVSKLWGNEPHIKVIAEWEQWVKDTVCIDIPDVSDDPMHPSVQIIREHYNTPLEATLDDCLEWHTKEEKLDDDEMYTCCRCSKSQIGATKRISFWTLPDILVIHMKRFEVDEYSHTKLNTYIKYPVRGLDMTPYLAKPEQPRPSSAMGFRQHALSPTHSSKSKSYDKQGSSSTLPLKGSEEYEELRKAPKDHAHPKSKQKFVWKKSKAKKTSTDPAHSHNTISSSNTGTRDSNIYDLYAVCNHHGNMDSGHYITQCCNPVDGKWYKYDDHLVLSSDDIITKYAYVLFYMRRGAKQRYSLCSTNDHHWINTQLLNNIDLTRIISCIPPETTKPSAQRQGSVTSAQTLSTLSGVSPDNVMITSPPRMEHATPSGHTHFPIPSPPHHSHQHSNSSGGSGPISPPNYPHSLPSPSHSTVSYFSQPSTKHISSYHGYGHHGYHSTSSDATRTTTRL